MAKEGMQKDDTTLTVDDSRLSDTQKESFVQAFMSQDDTVTWQGETYLVTAMEQAYPEENSEEIKVTFELKKV